MSPGLAADRRAPHRRPFGHEADMFSRSSRVPRLGFPRPTGIGGPPMLAFARAAFAAALVLIFAIPAIAADKPFKRDDLADAAIKLEAQIKAEAGTVTKSAAALKREADAAFQRNDFRLGMQILRSEEHTSELQSLRHL